jgi:hypothetical protein
MKKSVRKISLIQLASLPWTECSGAHKGVRKRTATGGATTPAVAVELKNQMKLQWHAPLAMRMLIPQSWNRVPSPIK